MLGDKNLMKKCGEDDNLSRLGSFLWPDANIASAAVDGAP